jgi:predicted PP-loop superfamily ATPase
MEDTRKECPWCKSKVIQKGASKCPRCHEYIEWKRMGKAANIWMAVIVIGLSIVTGGVFLIFGIPIWIFCALNKSPKKAEE